MGVQTQWTYQSPGGHHVVVLGTKAPADLYPDGEVLDCTTTDSLPMLSSEPLFLGDGSFDPEKVETVTALPAGMASEITAGQRLILQSHYINATADPILVRDALSLELVDPATVETWAAPLIQFDAGFALPPGRSSVEVDCTIDRDVDLLFLGGHMHEWGAAFSTELTRASGEATTLYDVPVWDPLYRDLPPLERYAEGELHLAAGDRLRTTCTWDNDTDHVMTFPEEMCVMFATAYPLEAPLICVPD
jgi:hypothetical protein